MKTQIANIALIDDDPLITSTIGWKLKELGNVKCASSYDSAINLIDQLNPSLAILDLHLGEHAYAGKNSFHTAKVKIYLPLLCLQMMCQS